ncbi:hypothetical protein [Breoghania sp. L-A4]|uniref:hypothetical protein n=1 Tax=Breoghania sp. L-A4 TaxID=2304600 RepID=UPI000E358AC8|nr:hypothetical protein [Breoghania sp. L-A4]AXS42610.1 hypothetical protein D1F64_13470 [Breoghania sp. L-A4]
MVIRYLIIALTLAALQGCAAVAVVGGAASLAGTAIGTTVGVATTAVDLAIPDSDDEDDES